MFSRGSWYCRSCYGAAEREFKASKKAEKAAKQAAREAAREEEYESEGGSSSSGELPSGSVKIVGMILAFLLVCGILGMLFCKDEDPNDPAVKMAKWEEHLENRRAAFAEGLPEEGVEARGLKNYTWEEWQSKGQGKQDKPAEKSDAQTMQEAYHVHMEKVSDAMRQGLSREQREKMGLYNYTYEEFKQNYKQIRYKSLEEIQQSAVNPAKSETVVRNDAATREKSEAEARARAESEARMRADARDKAEAEAKARGRIEKSAAEGAVSGQHNDASRKASKDSKAIGIVVQGKGKTREAALRYAFRQAVWKTVGTWVGSKTRIEENRAKVIAQVETITDADIRKFEVMDTQQQGDTIVVKVKVSVSKKQIAPKFAKVFPDVFANE